MRDRTCPAGCDPDFLGSTIARPRSFGRSSRQRAIKMMLEPAAGAGVESRAKAPKGQSAHQLGIPGPWS